MAISPDNDGDNSRTSAQSQVRVVGGGSGPVAENECVRAAADNTAEGGGAGEGIARTRETLAPNGARRHTTLKSIKAALDEALLEQNRIEATYESLLRQSETQLERIISEIAAERRRHEVTLSVLQTAAAEATSTARVVEAEADRLRSEHERKLADAHVDLLARTSEAENLRAQLLHERQEIERLERELLELSGKLEAQTEETGRVRSLLSEECEHSSHARQEMERLERDARELSGRLEAQAEETGRVRSLLAEERERSAHARQETERLERDARELSQSLEARSGETRYAQDLLAGERARFDETDQRLRFTDRQLAEARRDFAALKDTFDNQALKLESLDRLWLVRRRRSLLAIGRRLSGWRRRVVLRKRDNPLFDSEYYTAAYPDVAESGVDPYWHYLAHGAREGRNPNAMFQTAYYLKRYPDVAEQGVNPLVHYFEHGAAELRDPHPSFSTRWYVEQNREIMQPGQNPLLHYLTAERSRLVESNRTGLTGPEAECGL